MSGQDTTPTGAGARGGTRDLRRTVAVMAWSVVVWVALWGDLSPANVVWGAVLGGVTAWVVPVARPTHHLSVRVVPAVRFALRFSVSLVRASAVVAWEVVTPGSRIQEGIVAIPLRTASPGVVTLLANAVSLTPGTLTIEVRHDPATLFVHVLHLHDLAHVRADLLRLEDAALAAFAPRPTDPPTDPGAQP